MQGEEESEDVGMETAPTAEAASGWVFVLRRRGGLPGDEEEEGGVDGDGMSVVSGGLEVEAAVEVDEVREAVEVEEVREAVEVE